MNNNINIGSTIAGSMNPRSERKGRISC